MFQSSSSIALVALWIGLLSCSISLSGESGDSRPTYIDQFRAIRKDTDDKLKPVRERGMKAIVTAGSEAGRDSVMDQIRVETAAIFSAPAAEVLDLVKPHAADAEAVEADLLSDTEVHARMQKFFPNPKAYDIVHRNLYTVHQRVASTFRKGRVLLAGDSAHVNNSIGGMGLNGGLQDAANLSEKLVQVIGGAPDSLLDLYSLQRKTVSIEFVQAQSIANKKQLETREPEERKKVLADLSETASDAARAKAYLLRSSMISMQRRAAAITLDEAS